MSFVNPTPDSELDVERAERRKVELRTSNTCTCKAEHWQPHADSCPQAKQNKGGAVTDERDHCPCGHLEDGDQHACPITHARLRGNLSLAEEGLANYALEVAELKDSCAAYVAAIAAHEADEAEACGENERLRRALVYAADVLWSCGGLKLAGAQRAYIYAAKRTYAAAGHVPQKVLDATGDGEPTPDETFVHPYADHPHQNCACGAKVPNDVYVLHTCGDRLSPKATPEKADGLYGGKLRLACGCIDICTNQRDHETHAQKANEPPKWDGVYVDDETGRAHKVSDPE